MFGELKEKITQGKEELKKRLDTAYVRTLSPSSAIEVIASGNKEIIDIKFNEEATSDFEEFQDELILTVNRALEQASALHDEEMKATMSKHMPNIPGMDGLLNDI